METAIVSLICIALVVFGGMTMSQGFLTSVDSTTVGLKELGRTNEQMMRTELTPTDATSGGGGANVDVTLDNTGQTKLAEFSKWDVIVQYYDEAGMYYTVWLPYTSGTPTNNQWSVIGIYQGADYEVFEPNILNPGENIRIRAVVNPVVGRDTTNLVVIATPNGIPCTRVLIRN